MRFRRAAQCAAGMLCGAALAACATVKDEPMMSTPAALEGSAWVLSSLPGRSQDARSPATLSFEQGRASGSDGCNRFTAAYTQTGSALSIARPAGTMMACAPGIMRNAEAFGSALTSARSWRFFEGNLQLLGDGGSVLATLAPQSQALAGTRWEVNGINNGRQAVVSLVAGTSVTLQFGADGRLTGSSGCNNYLASYTVEDGRVRITAPAGTRKLCPAPGVMDQEAAFLKALEAATTLRIDGNRLELRDDAGALQVGAARAA